MLRFKYIQTLEEAKKWWEIFSPHQTICDSWEYRYLFYKYFYFQIYFIVGFWNDKPIGLLPLQRNSDFFCLEPFGGGAMEENGVFILPEYSSFLKDFYSQIKETAKIQYISHTNETAGNLKFLDYKYILRLQTIKNFEDYLTKYFDADGRGKMRRKMRKVEKYSVQIVKNRFEDIETLFTYNKLGFGQDSTFYIPFREEAFRDILQLDTTKYLMSFVIDGKVHGVSLALEYAGVYEYLNVGVQSDIRELRAYINMKNIEQALMCNAHTLNAFSSNCGWKELWHLEKVAQYEFLHP